MIAIIPARGGSKRIPQKNIREFCGKPLIYWTIKAAQESGVFEDIVVSTEEPKIAEIANSYGVKNIGRPMELATDSATTLDVIKWALQQITTNSIMVLQCTSPLRTSNDILKATLQFFKCHSLISVKPHLDGIYLQNGAIYAATTKFIKETGKLYNDESSLYLMPVDRSFDIDTEIDWQIAEMIMEKRLSNAQNIYNC